MFDRIKEVASADICKKVNATYLFDVEGEGKFFVDLKNGDGNVIQGDGPDKPAVKVTMNQASLIKMFNRKSLFNWI